MNTEIRDWSCFASRMLDTAHATCAVGNLGEGTDRRRLQNSQSSEPRDYKWIAQRQHAWITAHIMPCKLSSKKLNGSRVCIFRTKSWLMTLHVLHGACAQHCQHIHVR